MTGSVRAPCTERALARSMPRISVVFEQLGGFAPIPLMEDLELSRRLRRAGRIRIAPARVHISGRRFLAHPLRDTLLVNLFPLLFRAGVPPALLARAYRNTR